MWMSPWSPATPLAVTKEAGEKVIGGSINQQGSFIMRADKVGRDTMLAQIVQMVATAQRSRAPIQGMTDKMAAWFVPAVIGVALITFATWSLFAPQPPMAYGLIAAVSVLIIACPCALGLTTPMSIMVGICRGAQSGVLIRDAEALERMEKVDTVVVDKTGALTEGKPRVTQLVAAAGFPEKDLMRFAAGLEKRSERSDVAIESASITLLRGGLMGIVAARSLSLATMHNIRQNLFFPFVYNAAGIPLAAGVLYPFAGIPLSFIFAAAATSLSSISVIINALRLRVIKLGEDS